MIFRDDRAFAGFFVNGESDDGGLDSGTLYNEATALEHRSHHHAADGARRLTAINMGCLLGRFGHKHIILQPLSRPARTRRSTQVNSYPVAQYPSGNGTYEQRTTSPHQQCGGDTALS